MNPKEIDAMRARHYRVWHENGTDPCVCGQSWPCDAIVALDALEHERLITHNIVQLATGYREPE